ncbi:MAG: ribosome biogenesis factor YjgA [Burkholderiaceae bacterium]|jgi:ribosome-associated protein
MSDEKILDTEDTPEKPSKSELKRRMTALQKIGEQLADMPLDKAKRSPASERLLAAITEYHRSRSHEGRRRQRQYIGKLMRDEDGDALEAWITGESLEQKLAVTHMHTAEHWRDQLLQTPGSLNDFIAQYPVPSAPELHQLIRTARLEKEKNKPPRAARELYRLVFACVSQAGSGNV